MTLGKAIGKLRNEKGLTQAQLAAAVGIHRQHLHRLEKGDFQPRQQTLEKIAAALDTTTENLMALATIGIPAILTHEEPELSELLGQVHLLKSDQKAALATFLRALLTCRQMEQLMLGKAS